MSEAGTKIEIEDVLSSIRRLVSQDGSAGRTAAPVHANFATRRQDTPAVAPLRGAPVATPTDEADCLVLTPALRVEEEAEATDSVPAEDLGDELSRLETTIAQMEAAVSESGIAFEPELGDHFEAEGMPPLTDEAEAELAAADLDVMAATSDEAVEPVQDFPPEEFIWTRALAMREAGAAEHAAEAEEGAEDAPAAEDLDGQLARAAAEAEADVILEAETLHDLPSAEPAVTVQEAEAIDPEAEEENVTEAADVADETGAPLVLMPDVEVRDDGADQAAVAEAPVEEAPVEEAEVVTEAPVDPDLEDAAWDEAGAADWGAEPASDATEITAVEEIDLGAAFDAADIGLDPSEEDEGVLRRAHLVDAEEIRQKPEILRSSYETLRAEYAEPVDAPTGPNLFEAESEPVLDEEMLRDLVAELIRQELQGRLGERITQNVRKLVRREIQRALISREFE